MRPDLVIDHDTLLAVRAAMNDAAQAIGEISSGAYVTGNLFASSQGKTVDGINDTLAALVSLTDSLQLVAYKFAAYLEWVFLAFDEEDARMAQWLANFDVTAPSAQKNPQPVGTAGSPTIPHTNRATERRAVPQ